MKLSGICLLLSLITDVNAAEPVFLYAGTYTKGPSRGIYVWQFDTASGKLTPLGLAAAAENPSFLALHPNGKFVYAVNEQDNAGTVSAFAIEPGSGKLRFLNQTGAQGSAPCHISLDAQGRTALVANYGSGSIAALPIGPDGKLAVSHSVVQHHGSSVNRSRQEGPHAHCILPSRDDRFALVADLGLDQVLVYRLDAKKSSLGPVASVLRAKPGAGPRHFAFAPAEPFVYVIDEMTSTVTANVWDAKSGTLREIQSVSALPSGFSGANTGAEIAVHPNGKWLYTSNRGDNSIAVFGIERRTGLLKLVERVSTNGRTPRNFVLDPSGRWLVAANQDTGNLAVFLVDAVTGRLRLTANEAQVGSPVGLLFAGGSR